jgi:xylulokinase
MCLLLSLDLGTTSTKVALFDTEGRLLADSSHEYQLLTPQPGFCELPVETYWEACVAGIRQCLREHGGHRVRGIGLSSQGQTFVPLDAEGRPVYNAIAWLDTRAGDQTRRIAEHFSEREHYEKTGYTSFNEVASGPKILWLREHEPEVFKRTAHYLMLPDYIIWRLTGEMIGDPQDSGSTGMTHRWAGTWWPEMLEFIGLREEQLPPIGRCGRPAGTLLPNVAGEFGLSGDVVVVVGANDQTAGMIGAGNVRPGTVTATIGTALAVMATTDTFIEDPSPGVGTGIHAIPGLFTILSYTKTAAMALTWFRDAVCGDETGYDGLLREAEGAPPGCEGLLMLPHLTGTATPDFNADARGAFVGLSMAHKRPHMVRAILEAVAYSLREHLDRLADLGITPDSVRALGGGARSGFWLQMMADVTDVPMERPVSQEAASLGAAMLAAVGIGLYPSIPEAADAVYRVDRVFAPQDTHREVYDAAYAKFGELYRRLYGDAADV